MADEHVSLPPPGPAPDRPPVKDKPLPTDLQAAPPPAPAVNGEAPPPRSAALAELHQVLGWCAGLALVLACGWVLLYLAFWLANAVGLRGVDVPLALASLLSLGLFLLLERHFWLSKLMALHVPAWMPWYVSALFFWALGPVGLLFRSTAPRAEAAGGRPRPQPNVHQHAADSGREVVETIVFVVVLVLLLKSFAAEAFVIPTGSMAETLWGYQKVVECPDCGLKFPVNCSAEVEPQDEGGTTTPVTGCTCPNCRKHIPIRDKPSWNSGD